jgi:hypothetical protein
LAGKGSHVRPARRVFVLFIQTEWAAGQVTVLGHEAGIRLLVPLLSIFPNNQITAVAGVIADTRLVLFPAEGSNL